MKRLLKKLALLFLVFMQIGTIVPRAAFEDEGVGARAPGMTNVNVAIADDADALYYNPAGLAGLKDGEVSTQYGQVLTGTDDGSSNTHTYLGYAHPLQNKYSGTLGLGYNMFNANNLFSERTLILSYGRRLQEALFDWNGLWSVGLNAKQLYREYKPDRFTENALNDAAVGTGQSDPLFARNGYDKTAYALDAGLLVRFGRENRQSAGLTIVNLNQPDVSLGGDGDKPPFITKLGYAHRSRWGLLSGEVRRARRLASQTDTDIAFGAERRFKLSQEDSAFTLRGGYALGSREYQSFTTGLSYEFGRMGLDYAFSFPIGNLAEAGASHRLGLSILLPASVKKKESRRPEEELIISAPRKEEIPEAPQVLVAPQQYGKSSDQRNVSELEADAKNYGVLLGIYFKRKEQGSSLDEQRSLLEQMKSLYTGKGIDLTLIERELKNIEPIPTAPSGAPSKVTATDVVPMKVIPTNVVPTKVVPTKVEPANVLPVNPTPIKTAPTKAVQKPLKIVKPRNYDSMSSLSQLAATSPELDQAMKYYNMAVQRGISDNERIEVLEAILTRFGETGAKRVNTELERLRKRSR